MMKFQTILKIFFLTGMISSSLFNPSYSVNSLPQIKDGISYGYFKGEPPIKGDGGSRFAEPFTPQNQDPKNLKTI